VVLKLLPPKQLLPPKHLLLLLVLEVVEAAVAVAVVA
jgi:hypothetical protein